MPNKWIKGGLPQPPKFLEDFSNAFTTVVSAITAFIDTVTFVIDIIATLASFAIDPLKAIQQAFIDFLTGIIEAIANIGVAFFAYLPHSWDLEGATGYQGFLKDFEASLYDVGDFARPQLKDDTPFFAFALLFGANSPEEVLGALQAFVDFTQGLFDKYKNFSITVVPQAPFIGVVEGMDVAISVVDDKEVLSVGAGKVLLLKDTSPNDIKEFAGQPVVDAYEASSPSVLVTWHDYNRDDNSFTVPVLPISVGRIYDEIEMINDEPSPKRVVEINHELLDDIGRAACFLAYFETDGTGKITKLNPDYRVKYTNEETEVVLMQRDQLGIESTKPDWVGYNVRHWPAFNDAITWLENSLKKVTVSSNLADSLHNLSAQLSVISQDLTDVAQKVKDTSQQIQDFLGALGEVAFMFITPWPTLMSAKDPFRFVPGDQFALNKEATVDQAITINATAGHYLGGPADDFIIDAGAAFRMEVYRRRLVVELGGTIDTTIGFTGGTQISPGVFVTTDRRFFRPPNAGGAIKVSTFGEGLEIMPVPTDAANMMNFTYASSLQTIQSNNALRYHFPTGSSLKLSAWTSDISISNAPSSILNIVGWTNNLTGGGVIEGFDSKKFNTIVGASATLTTMSYLRSYPTSDLRSMFGFSTVTPDGLIDTGSSCNDFNIYSYGGYRFSLAIRALSVTGGTARTKLGLVTTTEDMGVVLGTNSDTYTFPADTITLNTKSNALASLTGEVSSLVKWDSIPYANTSILGTDSRLFSWALNSGFHIKVSNLSGVVLEGDVKLIVAATDRNGTALANQLTYTLRHMLGNRGLEICTYNTSTGDFEFFFGVDVITVEFSTSVSYPTLTILDLVGLTAGSYIPVLGIINCLEPVSYKIVLGTFGVKLGLQNFNVTLPPGSYTGTALATALQNGLRTATGSLETIAFDLTTGRFALTIDPAGYTWINNLNIVIPISTQVPNTQILTYLNANFPYTNGNGTETFLFDNGVFSFRTQGMMEITLSATSSILTTLGLAPGTFPVSGDQHNGSEPAPFYFDPGEGILNLAKNRLPAVINLSESTPLTFTQIKTEIETGNPDLQVTYPGYVMRIEEMNNRTLVTNYLMSYGPSVLTLANIAADIKSALDTALVDTLAVVAVFVGVIVIGYPDLARLEFTPPPLGDDMRGLFGLTDQDVTNTYISAAPKNFSIDTAGLEFKASFGSNTFTTTFNDVGYFTGDEIAAEIQSQWSPIPNAPQISYDLATGTFQIALENAGYAQIDSQTWTLPAGGLIDGDAVAMSLELTIQALPGSLGNESVRYIGGVFIVSNPLLAGLTITSIPFSPSIVKILGFVEGTNELINHRISGNEPLFYLASSGYTNFVFNTNSNSYPVSVPATPDFESGMSLASRIETALQAATGGSETVTYDLDNGRFSIHADPEGALDIDNIEIILTAESAYITFAEIVNRINAQIQIAVPGTSLIIAESLGTFRWEMDNLTKLEFDTGSVGLDLLDMLGFVPGSSGVITGEYPGSSPKNFVVDTDNNTLKLKLGSQIYIIVLLSGATLYDGAGYAALVEPLIQAASGRNTTLKFNADNNTFTLAVDPTGEKMIIEGSLTIPGGTFYSGFDLLPILNTISALPGATGGESFTFNQIDSIFTFHDSSKKILAIDFIDPFPTFDFSPVLGFAPTNSITPTELAENILDASVAKYYIITAAENNLVKLSVNLELVSEAIPPGIYDGDTLAGVLKTAIETDTTHIEDVTWDVETGFFTLTSNPTGKQESNQTYVLPALTGNGSYIASQLQALIRATSPDPTEDVLFESSVFTIAKPDLIKLVFDNAGGPMLYILQVLGIEPLFEYETDVAKIILGEPAPFTITSTHNQFGVTIDDLDLGQVALTPVAGVLKGSEMATLIQAKTIERLVALALFDVFYFYTLGWPIVLGNPTYPASSCSRKNLDTIIEAATELMFSSNNQDFNNDVSQTTQPAVNIPFPLFQQAYDQITSWGSGLASIWSNVGQTQKKNGFKQLLEVALKGFYPTTPYYVKPDQIGPTILPNLKSALQAAALALNVPLSNTLRDITADFLAGQIEGLVTSKYFWNVAVEYVVATSRFKMTSPTFGLRTKVEMFTGTSNDLTSYIGWDLGTAVQGTGNVKFVHLVSSREVTDLLNAAGFTAFSWGYSAFRTGRTEQGAVKNEDIFYPHRHYTRDELSHGAEIQLFFFSLLSGPDSTLECKNVTGTPADTLGFPVGITGGLQGANSFVGAFREAGNPDQLNETAFIFCFVGCIVLAGPSVFKDEYNKLGTLLGLPKWE